MTDRERLYILIIQYRDEVNSRVRLFPFCIGLVRIRGQGARVPLGWSVSRVYARLSAL